MKKFIPSKMPDKITNSLHLLSGLLVLFLFLACPENQQQDSDFSAELKEEFTTDWSIGTLTPLDIFEGSPKKDEIPSLTEPKTVGTEEANPWFQDQELVSVLSVGEETLITAHRILIWHEIVNTTLGGMSVSITYCPLCNSTIVFDRSVGSQTLSFGVTGRLHGSNLLMYDRQTESWWQQITGKAVLGEKTGTQLNIVPSRVLSWQRARDLYPEAQVVSIDTGWERPYGTNPYVGYDTPGKELFLFRGELPPEGIPQERALTLELSGQRRTYYYPELFLSGPTHFEIAERALVIITEPGTASPVDHESVPGGRPAGSANAFFRELEGQILEFERSPEGLRDTNTGSLWDPAGVAIGGALSGKSLRPAPGVQAFRFASYHFFGQ